MIKVINSHDKDLVTLAKKNHHILTFFVELVTTSFFYQNYFCIMVSGMIKISYYFVDLLIPNQKSLGFYQKRGVTRNISKF